MESVRSLLRLGPWVAGALVWTAVAGLPDVDAIDLEGSYPGHLQDVWFDGTHLYWAHTETILKTDLSGHVLARAYNASYHHAGLQIRNGRLYTAICLQTDMDVVGTKGLSRVVVGEYDAATLKVVAIHETEVEDRAGSLAILEDGTFLVGCLRQNDMGARRVRFHHLDADFKLIESILVDNAPVQMGIEVLKVIGPFRYLFLYGKDASNVDLDFSCIKLDSRNHEIWRGTIDGCCGFVLDGASYWTGETNFDPSTGRYTSRLVRNLNDLPSSVAANLETAANGARAFEVSCDALPVPRVLYFGCGETDAGADSTNGWAQVRRVAEVPAGTTRVTDIPVPQAFGTEFGVGRFFLGPSAEAGSAAYAQNGLIAQWDGIDNAGRGTHDPAAAFPRELVTGRSQTRTGTIPAGARAFSLGAGSLAFDGTDIVAACNAGAATVEVVMTPNAAPLRNGGILAFGDTARALWVYEGDTSIVGDMTYRGRIANDYQSVLHPAASPRTETNLFSFVLGPTSRASRLFVDGTKAVSYGLHRFETACTDTLCRIGALGGSWSEYRGRVDICSLRIYDRPLTLAEIECNRFVDALRFTGGKSATASAPVTCPVPFSIQKLKTRKGVFCATVRLQPQTFPRTIVAAWGRRDGGLTTNGWTFCRVVCEVPSGTGRVVDVPLPFSDDPAMVGRLFLCGGDSASYISDGLLAQWDGIDNAGRGAHDPNAAYPVDLAGGLVPTVSGTVSAKGDRFSLGAGDLTFTSPAICAVCNAGTATIEIVMAPNDVPVHNGGILAFGDAARAFWIYEKNYDGVVCLIGDYTYHGELSGQYATLDLSAARQDAHSYSFVLGTDAATLFLDGEPMQALRRFSVDCTDDVCRIGSLGGSWTGLRAKVDVHSIRVYGRRLSAEEVAHNAAVDQIRFLSHPEVSGLIPDRKQTVLLR